MKDALALLKAMEDAGWSWHLWTVRLHKKPIRYHCCFTYEGQMRAFVDNGATPEEAVSAAIETTKGFSPAREEAVNCEEGER